MIKIKIANINFVLCFQIKYTSCLELILICFLKISDLYKFNFIFLILQNK